MAMLREIRVRGLESLLRLGFHAAITRLFTENQIKYIKYSYFV